MVAMNADSQAADEFLSSLFGGICFLGEKDESSASTPRRLLLYPILMKAGQTLWALRSLRLVDEGSILDKISEGL
jgi:hypothetical protein